MLLGRAHLARQLKRVGGRICGCAKLLAGTLRCLRLVDFSLGVGLTRNSWGVAPNPTRGAASGLRKGKRKRDEVSPLTPCARLSCFLFPYFFRVLLFWAVSLSLTTS